MNKLKKKFPSCPMHQQQRIGTDLLSLIRFKGLFDRFKERLVRKILSEKEILFYQELSNDRRRLEYLGGRFCAKEAIFKAAMVPNLTWERVSIIPESVSGRPIVLIDDFESDSISISISHERDYAISTAFWSSK